MTTADHQWLATAFIPDYIIEDVMKNKSDTSNVVGGGEHLIPVTPPSNDQTEPIDPIDTDNIPVINDPKNDGSNNDIDKDDILGQKKLKVGDKDYAGYTISVNDIDEGLIISDISGSGYRGKVMLIDDPSRVYLGVTDQKGVEGVRIRTMMASYGAIAGINASGFADPNDSGTGGDIIGLSYAEGEFWGSPVEYYGSILITKDDKLVVGNVKDWENYEIRAGIQFGPVLIADGKAQIQNSGGYGIQPRTAIGQREDGVIVFLVIDGRNPTWSIGCTMGDLVEILQKYGVVNAACCDGGSSSVLAYNGSVINKNSSLNPEYGRRLPNAFLVSPKSAE
ncbi:MAG: phosphodiester glycosidase family protein [Clostridiales bacterium]|nr:phosphodiester glycosidase family protein [Clostridiales bacterium]